MTTPGPTDNPMGEGERGADEWIRIPVTGPERSAVEPDISMDVDEPAADDEAACTEEAEPDPIASLEAQLAEERDRALRLQADFENFRKRSARERLESEELGKARLIQKLLPALDNLDRALSAGANENSGLAEGVAMVRNQLLSILEAEGLSSMQVVGVPFDPTIHEAVLTMASDEVPPGYVATEIQRGYLLGERVLRQARVVIASDPADAGSEGD